MSHVPDCRLPDGGLIDRNITLNFSFDGIAMRCYSGDTLASALLANGQHLVARSLKYHHPRGIVSAGLEEPSALVTVTDQYGSTPNLKVTEVVMRDGLTVTSQNNYPSLKRDYGRFLKLGGGALSAGFYYKTFLWPKHAWHKYFAPIIRNLAGQGRVDPTPDHAQYDKRRKFCDVLVIGSGPAGCAAALTAAQGGATTILIEQDHILGGSLLFTQDSIDGLNATDWAADTSEALHALSNVTVMTRTLAFGQYDHGLIQAIETGKDGDINRAIMWKIRARKIILATGAIERPVVFPGNDKPGIMLANAVCQYIRRFAVSPGTRAVVAVAAEEDRLRAIAAMQDAGIEIAAILSPGDQIISATGRLHVNAVTWKNDKGQRQRTKCDLVVMSAGWMPTAHIFAQMGENLTFHSETRSFLPSLPEQSQHHLDPVGGARGVLHMDACLADGKASAHDAMADFNMHKHLDLPRPAVSPAPIQGFERGKGKAFIDFQNDVTTADIALAQREGYGHIELTKRYTTLGMGTDQGKTSWTNGLLEMLSISDIKAAEIGHTTYRPPYSPVSIGALVGTETGQQMTPIRHTPFHKGFTDLGCVFQTSGDWLYSRYFPQPDETMAAAIKREALAVRNSLGCVDMSTLGKIDIYGADAMLFLSRLYCNNFATLKTGQLRYVLMLREDGYVLDDGTISRLGENHFHLTITTANAGKVWQHLKKAAMVDWPELDVTLTSVSDQWASLAIAGPYARDLLSALKPDFDVSPAGLPFASVRIGHLDGYPVRVFGVSFSGELSYEINFPSGYADALLSMVMEHGKAWNITPYGLETLDVLRIEKGHLSIGTEIDGRRTADDLGLGKMLSRKKDFVGRALSQRPAMIAEGRQQLIGLISEQNEPIPHAAHLSNTELDQNGCAESLGFLTAAIYSPVMDHYIALGFLKNGRQRIGDTVWAHSPIAGQSIRLKVTSSCFYDQEGGRYRA